MKDFLKENCTLLVSTCDAYSDCWDGFFQLLKIQWPDCSLPIVLNTEHKDYAFDGLPIRVLNQVGSKKQAWGRRLINALKRIDTKYVLFTLEDFYLEEPVLVDEVEKCCQYMEENSNIAYFSFYPTEDENNVPSDRYPGFERRPQKGAYRLNCQFALWNRELLISYIRPHESPWDWEVYGSRRSSRYYEEMYTLSHSAPSVFSYNRGKIIMRGRWYVSEVQPLIEKYKLNIDLSTREDFESFRNDKRRRNLWRGIKNRINKIRSLI